MEEQSAWLKTISHQLDNLNRDIPELQAKVSKAEPSISSLSDAQFSLINRMAAKPDPFATTNALQVRIDENVRMLAELHVRWEREDKMARNMKVCTITTTSDVVSNASNPLTLIGVEKTPTPCVKKPKTTKTFSTKSAGIFRSMGDNRSTSFNDIDVDGFNISEVILFLQKLALSPNASSMNVASTKHITNALMQIREEKLKQKVSIPKKLEDGWEPIIDMNVNDFIAMLYVILAFLLCLEIFMICLVYHRLKLVIFMFLLLMLLRTNLWDGLMMFLLWLTITLFPLIFLFWMLNAMLHVLLFWEDLFLE
jgi:hypothetical protein